MVMLEPANRLPANDKGHELSIEINFRHDSLSPH